MNNSIVLYNNSFIAERSPAYICKLDQIDLINTLSKYPKVIFFFLLLSLLILTIYLLYPKVKEWIPLEKIIFPLYMLVLSSTFILMFFVFNITSEVFKKRFEPIFYIVIGICAIAIIIREWREYKRRYK